jgi:hypothetical protein
MPECKISDPISFPIRDDLFDAFSFLPCAVNHALPVKFFKKEKKSAADLTGLPCTLIDMSLSGLLAPLNTSKMWSEANLTGDVATAFYPNVNMSRMSPFLDKVNYTSF